MNVPPYFGSSFPGVGEGAGVGTGTGVGEGAGVGTGVGAGAAAGAQDASTRDSTIKQLTTNDEIFFFNLVISRIILVSNSLS